MNYLKVLIIGILMASMILAGCTQQQQDEEPGVTQDPEPDQTPDTGDETVQTVEATLSEFNIELSPSDVEAGTVTFEVSNSGNWRHEFAIEGNGVMEEVEGGIDAGDSATLEVELEAGTYKVYCPIPGHEDRGMVAELVVE